MARVGDELLVIVGRVLIALYTNTWIQTQQDRDSEGRHLKLSLGKGATDRRRELSRQLTELRIEVHNRLVELGLTPEG